MEVVILAVALFAAFTVTGNSIAIDNMREEKAPTEKVIYVEKVDTAQVLRDLQLKRNIKMEELRFLQVRKETHAQTKRQALENGLSIKDYIQKLLDADKKKG